jgi:hypothetical protein
VGFFKRESEVTIFFGWRFIKRSWVTDLVDCEKEKA